ncbi:MAG: 6-carboxytetrahydropterin synthase [Planctomycetota bacterium]
MILTREVRLVLGAPPDAPVLNSWSGWPASDRLLPTMVARLSVEGAVSAEDGMICDIQVLDRLVRRVVPEVAFAAKPAAAYLVDLWEVLVAAEGGPAIAALEIELSPRLKFVMTQQQTSEVTLVHQFEFSAAHRLHSDQLDDDQNRRVFGKCNSLNGHGHNYVLEVSVMGPLSSTGEVYPLEKMQTVVRDQVVERFDHKHLNKDCDEFRETNPTVENIAHVCWQLLEGQFEPARLTHLRLYETPKTWVDLTA